MPAEPFYDASRGEVKHTENRRSIEARGVENIHTELIHRQYGLAAITGGHIDAKDFAFIQVLLGTVNFRTEHFWKKKFLRISCFTKAYLRIKYDTFPIATPQKLKITGGEQREKECVSSNDNFKKNLNYLIWKKN